MAAALSARACLLNGAPLLMRAALCSADLRILSLAGGRKGTTVGAPPTGVVLPVAAAAPADAGDGETEAMMDGDVARIDEPGEDVTGALPVTVTIVVMIGAVAVTVCVIVTVSPAPPETREVPADAEAFGAVVIGKDAEVTLGETVVGVADAFAAIEG